MILLEKMLDIDPKDFKIVLNLHGSDGQKFIDGWNNGTVKIDDVRFSYWSHYAPGKRNFSVGDKVLGFMRTEADRYLFITAGRITSVPETPSPCGYAVFHEFDDYIGRLVIRTHKGNTYARYVFKMDRYLDKRKIEVSEILRAELKPVEFRGFENVHLTFPVLLQVLDSEKFADYRKNLASVKGVYCLTDRSNGKLYIGSAYGVDGVAQRWKCYLDTKTGGNVKLVELYNNKGPEYFNKHFTFTLLEYFGRNTSDDRILARENYWKEAFDTRRHGYNDN